MNVMTPEDKRLSVVETFWHGENSSNIDERVRNGLSLSLPVRGLQGGNLNIGEHIGYKDIRGAIDYAVQVSAKSSFVPLISCLRLPLKVLKKEHMSDEIIMLDQRLDPLELLVRTYLKHETDEFSKYAERIAWHFVWDKELYNKKRPLLFSMFTTACRLALARQKDWEQLIRVRLSQVTSDTNWLAIDRTTNFYLKPMPTMLRVEPTRDAQTLRYLFRNAADSFSKEQIVHFENKRIMVDPNFSDRSQACIDFIFTIDAVWNTNTNKVPSTVKNYQLGICSGSPHLDFLTQWTRFIGSAENIVYADKRSNFT